MRQRLVDERAARDEHEIAARQQQDAGAVGVVALLRRALEGIDRPRLLVQTLRAAHMPDDAHGHAAQVDPLGAVKIHRGQRADGFDALRRVEKSIGRGQTERGLLQVPAFDGFGRLAQRKTLHRREHRGDAASLGEHGHAGGGGRLDQGPALAQAGVFDRIGALYARDQRVVEREKVMLHFFSP